MSPRETSEYNSGSAHRGTARLLPDGKMPFQPLLDVGEYTVVLRFVEHLVIKAVVNDELLVEGSDFFIELLRPGRIDETIGASLEDQERKRDPVRFSDDTHHCAEQLRSQTRRHLPPEDERIVQIRFHHRRIAAHPLRLH